jgi:hypothetical protein
MTAYNQEMQWIVNDDVERKFTVRRGGTTVFSDGDRVIEAGDINVTDTPSPFDNRAPHKNR